jgi:4-amino-4-deoxy-L-arabinose transferase-like glycosyltransferase
LGFPETACNDTLNNDIYTLHDIFKSANFKKTIVQIYNHPQTDEQKKSELNYVIALLILCAAVNFFGLGKLPFLGPDEPRYAEVAREMYQARDWISPTLGGISWFEKPVLTYWLSITGYNLFGVSEFAARFGIAVVASFGVLLLYFFGKKIRSSRFGYLSASVLVTCGMWPGFSRSVTFDLTLSVALELALLSFFLWQSGEDGKGKMRLWCLFSFALGVAVLAKGLVGIVLPAIIIGPFLILTRRLRIVLKPGLLLSGIFILAATAATWYWPVISRHGAYFINEFFLSHHFQRYVSNKFRHPQPFYFFVIVVLAGSFPWSFFFLSNAWDSLKRLWNRCSWASDPLSLFLWLWVLMPILFFSFSGSKLPGYILPVFPPIAMIIGMELQNWWKNEPKRMKFIAIATALLMITVASVFALIGGRQIGLTLFDAYKVATIAIAAAVIYLALWVLLSGRAATLFLPFALALVIVTAMNVIAPVLGKSESLRDLSMLAQQLAKPGERLIFYLDHDQGINFYATDLPLRDGKSELLRVMSFEELESLVEARGGVSILVISPRYWSDKKSAKIRLQIEMLGEQKRNIRCSPGCDWVLFRAELKSPESGVRSPESEIRSP